MGPGRGGESPTWKGGAGLYRDWFMLVVYTLDGRGTSGSEWTDIVQIVLHIYVSPRCTQFLRTARSF